MTEHSDNQQLSSKDSLTRFIKNESPLSDEYDLQDIANKVGSAEASTNPNPLSSDTILQLQRTLGNQAVLRLVTAEKAKNNSSVHLVGPMVNRNDDLSNPAIDSSKKKIKDTPNSSITNATVDENSSYNLKSENKLQRKPPTKLSKSTPPTKNEIQKARKELNSYRDTALKFVLSSGEYLRGNWIDYLSATSSNPSLGWTESFTYSMVSNAFGNALTTDTASTLAKKALSKGATKMGAAGLGTAIGSMGGPLGAAIGFGIGVLVESVAGVIFDAITGKTEAGEAAAKASRTTGRMIAAKSIEISKKTKEAHSKTLSQYDALMKEIDSVKDANELKKIVDEAKKLKLKFGTISTTDRSLYKAMIHDWILEHAGDEEDAAKGTDNSQWKATLETAKNPKKENEKRAKAKLPPLPKVLKSGADLDNHPEIFAYQTRKHLKEVGLDASWAQKLITEVKSTIGNNKSGQILDADKAVMKKFDTKSITFKNAKDTKALLAFMKKNQKANFSHKEQFDKILKQQFIVTVKLRLNSSDGSVYINAWDYHLDLLNVGKYKNYNSHFKFWVSPDSVMTPW